MKTVLVLTGDTLFGSIILNRLKRRGACVLSLLDPAKVEDYLSSGEISLLIIDTAGKPFSASLPKLWLAHPGVCFIIAGDPVPAGFPEGSVDGRRVRRVPRKLLVKLVEEIVLESVPGLLPEEPMPLPRPMAEDRRGFPRTERSLRVFLSNREGPAGPKERSRTLDISASGAKIVTDRPLVPNEQLDMDLLLPSFSERVPVKARVVWSKPIEDQRHYLAGVFFDWFSETDRHKLTHLLSESLV